MREARTPDGSSLRDYLQVVRRRKWIILGAIVLVPIVAVLVSARQKHVYGAQAQDVVNHVNLGSQLTGAVDTSALQSPDRVNQTYADIATVPAIGVRMRQALALRDRAADVLLAQCGVAAQQGADILTFTCRDRDPTLVTRMATEYARQAALYAGQTATAQIEFARREVAARIAELDRSGNRNTGLYNSLVEKEQQLRTMEALQSSPLALIRSASSAYQIQPKPLKDGLVGLALGIVVGIGLGFLRDGLDTRIRSAEEVAERLGLPLLARLPEPPRRLRAEDRLVMLDEPNDAQAEPFRMLRTNLDFANLERGARTIMITSAVEAEGKSTTVANLAVALARAGRRVVLVDLDLRRPFLGRFFHLGDQPGLTHVALGRVDLEEALVQVALTEAPPEPASSTGNGHGKVHGVLEVLLSGPIPPNAGEFVSSRALGDILARLSERADIVLVDAPPLLHVGDAMALSAKVDAIIAVTRLEVARRHVVDELRRVLHNCPATKLGFALTGANHEDGYYGYGSGYYYTSRYELPRPEALA